MNFRRAIHTPSPLVFNVISLIDILLVLVAFLILTWNPVSRAENNVNIELPSARSGTPTTGAPAFLVVNIAADGAATVNGRRLEDEELRSMLKTAHDLTPGQSVIVRGDRHVNYQRILAVLDLCSAAGVTNVGFSSLPVKDAP